MHESSNKFCIVSVENAVFAAPNKIWTRFIGYPKYASLLVQEQSHEKKMKSCWKKKYVLINPETLHVKDTSIQVEHLLVIHG